MSDDPGAQLLEEEERTLRVPDAAAGLRLDRFLADQTGASRRRVMAAIEAGAVRVDGRRAKKGVPLQAGQEVRARLPRIAEPPVPQPELPLTVLHADDAVVVVDKPSGRPSHPLVPGEQGTLANALVARFPDCARAGDDVREAGLAQRLDIETSGVMVAARTPEAWAGLRRQFAARTVLKEYLALVAGAVFGPEEITAPIGRDGSPGKFRTVPDERHRERLGAREAITLVEIERRFTGWTLVRCRIATGVTHQIRVHLAHLGTPVAGDDLYGGARPAGLHRMFLHASRLAFDHPATGARCTVDAPLPAELSAVLESLGA